MVPDAEIGFKAIFQKYMEKVIYFCQAENISPNLAVHEIRKSFKRMRALLKFYAHSSHPYFNDLKKQMLTSGKSISELRESAVNIQVFDQLSLNNLVAERKLKLVKGRLVEKNMNLVRTNFDDKDIAAEILDLFKDYEMKLTIFEEECPVREQIIERIFKSFDHAYFRYQKLDSNMEGEVLHDLRKKMKILWYQMDFIKFLNPKYLIVKTEQVHKLTEYLGDDHDLHVFLKEFFSNSYGLGEKEIEIIGNQVNHLREINSLKLIPGLKQFFGGSSETFKQKLKAIFNV